MSHASVVMTEKYAKFNLRKLKDDFPSIADKIEVRLTPPADDTYFMIDFYITSEYFDIDRPSIYMLLVTDLSKDKQLPITEKQELVKHC